MELRESEANGGPVPGGRRSGYFFFAPYRLRDRLRPFTPSVSSDLPQEVDRDTLAISFRKGCYLGQETVARIDALGHVNRLLTRLVSSDTLTPAPGTPLLLDGQTVGQVTSSAFSPSRGKGLVLAYVRCSARTPGLVLVTPEGSPLTVDAASSSSQDSG